jgi:transposase
MTSTAEDNGEIFKRDTRHQPGGDVIYEWHTTRAASCLEHLIPIEFAGTVQCDGYSAYDRFASRRE